MRVAVTLPSHEAGTAHRAELDATLAALARGAEIEGFAESTRLRSAEPLLECPRWHYLRLAERHRAEPFDAALYPLGRDFRIYEPSWICMQRLPGLVWVLDPVLHHLAIAGLCFRGRWDVYFEMLESAFGPGGRGLAHAMASWWVTPAVYARRDPVPRLLERQPRIVVADSRITHAWRGPEPSGVVALPRAGAVTVPGGMPPPPSRNTVPGSGSTAGAVLTLVTWNFGRPGPTLEALRRLTAQPWQGDGLTVRAFVPEPVFEDRIEPALPTTEWLRRVQWQVTSDAAAMRRAVDTSTFVAFLRDDVTFPDRALIRRALARGSVIVALDTPAYAELGSAVVRVAPGWELALALPELVRAIAADEQLLEVVRGRGRSYLESLPDAEQVSARLVGHLEALPRPACLRDVAAPVRVETARGIERCILPPGLSMASRRTVHQQAAHVLGPGWLPPLPTGA